ncbi:MAG TPA: SDR family oxidoreductase [Kofleriaceae bacterium]|nr:SDR family oxidoreductase [Kofleriaceae bacterium]
MTQPIAKNILITGATSGIGRDAALDLARRGFRVFATGRNAAALARLEAENLANLTAFRLDVADTTSIAEARARILEATAGAGIDILINNAGYGDLGPAEEVTDADLRAQFETNVFGLMAVTRAFLPEMRERRGGRILNVSSIGGRVTMPLFGAYSASKYAVEALSDALRMELFAFGIRVVLIEPGPINTEFTSRAMDNADKYRDPSSPYAPMLARAERLSAMAERAGVPPAVTTRAIRRAITSRRPRARYVAPFRGHLAIAMARLVPTWLTDAAMRSMTGFTRKHLDRSLAAGPHDSLPRPA